MLNSLKLFELLFVLLCNGIVTFVLVLAFVKTGLTVVTILLLLMYILTLQMLSNFSSKN